MGDRATNWRTYFALWIQSRTNFPNLTFLSRFGSAVGQQLAAIELATSWRYVTEPMLRDQSLLSTGVWWVCVCVWSGRVWTGLLVWSVANKNHLPEWNLYDRVNKKQKRRANEREKKNKGERQENFCQMIFVARVTALALWTVSIDQQRLATWPNPLGYLHLALPACLPACLIGCSLEAIAEFRPISMGCTLLPFASFCHINFESCVIWAAARFCPQLASFFVASTYSLFVPLLLSICPTGLLLFPQVLWCLFGPSMPVSDTIKYWMCWALAHAHADTLTHAHTYTLKGLYSALTHWLTDLAKLWPHRWASPLPPSLPSFLCVSRCLHKCFLSLLAFVALVHPPTSPPPVLPWTGWCFIFFIFAGSTRITLHYMSVAGRSRSAGLGSRSMSVSALKGSAMAWPRLGARHFLITLYAISLLFRHTRHTHTDPYMECGSLLNNSLVWLMELLMWV